MTHDVARVPARAEVIGSLLRPLVLRDAVDRHYEPGHSAALDEERSRDRGELTAVEDEAILGVVRRQRDCGLDVITDGEFRRWMFMNSFYDAVRGVRTGKAVTFRNDRGEPVELAVHEIVSPLEPVASPAAGEAAFMSTLSPDWPFKVTFPAASIFAHPFTTVAGAYDSVDAFVDAAVEIERSLVADAIAEGAGYIQFDFPLYPYLADPAWVARFEAAGHDTGDLLESSLAADAAVLEGLPDDVTVGLHICRGNYRSSWMCEGSLEPVAERVFGDLDYDSFLVEWDDEGRDGGFEPVRHLRDDSIMVMGLVNSKTPVLEDEEDLIRAMERAATYAGGMERLAISPQCGFASVMVGNETNEDAQWRKLELVGKVADRLWG